MKPSTEHTFAERADKIANLLLDGLKEGVKEEQGRQKQLKFAAQRLFKPTLLTNASQSINAVENETRPAINVAAPAHSSGLVIYRAAHITGNTLDVMATATRNVPNLQISGHAIDMALRPFKKQALESGILKEARTQEHYEKPSDKRRREAATRLRKIAREKHQAENRDTR